jgi:hypothetical protein
MKDKWPLGVQVYVNGIRTTWSNEVDTWFSLSRLNVTRKVPGERRSCKPAAMVVAPRPDVYLLASPLKYLMVSRDKDDVLGHIYLEAAFRQGVHMPEYGDVMELRRREEVEQAVDEEEFGAWMAARGLGKVVVSEAARLWMEECHEVSGVDGACHLPD